MNMDFYINVNAETPNVALVRSQVTTSQVACPEFVRGNKIVCNVYLVDGIGNFDAISGVAGYTVAFGLGTPGQTSFASTSFSTLITNGWQGTLDLSTAAVTTKLGTDTYVDAYFELQITKDSDSSIRTFLQGKTRVLNKIL